MNLGNLVQRETNNLDETNDLLESRHTAVPTWVRTRPRRSLPPGRPIVALSSGVEEVFLTRLDQPRRVPDAVQFEELRTLLESELNAFVAEFEATFTSNLPGPIQFVSRLAERWELSNAEIAALLGLDTPESASDVLRGLMSLRGRDAEDRLANLFRIFEALFGLLQDADEEKRWLRQPSDHFNGLTCLDVMLKGGIENLVDVRRWVEHLAGR